MGLPISPKEGRSWPCEIGSGSKGSLHGRHLNISIDVVSVSFQINPSSPQSAFYRNLYPLLGKANIGRRRLRLAFNQCRGWLAVRGQVKFDPWSVPQTRVLAVGIALAMTADHKSASCLSVKPEADLLDGERTAIWRSKPGPLHKIV